MPAEVCKHTTGSNLYLCVFEEPFYTLGGGLGSKRGIGRRYNFCWILVGRM